jgi:hypothetical protein
MRMTSGANPYRMRVFSTVIHSWQAAPTFAPAPRPTCAMP